MAEPTLKEIQKMFANNASQREVETINLNKAFGVTADGAKSLGKALYDGTGALLSSYQKISSSGANFSGDILGMGKAAYNSRLSLDQFATLMKESAPAFAGLGGNITRGAEAFQKLQKSFFDASGTSALRDLGYTSKELNDVLALTVGMQKASYKDDETGRKQSIRAASELAFEMDAIAKLTGKSREAQMEEMKKNQVDGRIEAKFRLMSANKSEAEIGEMKLQYQKGLAQAQANGTTEMYKQFFATGTYNTQNARTQSALMGQQTRAMEQQIKAMQSGDYAKAAEARSRVDSEAMKNANNRTLNSLATFGDSIGIAGSIAQKNVETTDAMFQNVKKIAENNGIILNTQEAYGRALKLAYADISAAQQMIRGGKFVGASGQVAVTAQQAAQDVRSAGATAMEQPAQQFAAGFTGASSAYRTTRPDLRIEGQAQRGNAEVSPVDENGRTRSPGQMREERGGLPGEIVRTFNTGATVFGDAVGKFLEAVIRMPTRATGSLGTTGSLIENFGKGTLAMLHGKEGVVTEDQLKNIAAGMKQEGVSNAINTLMGAMPKEMQGNLTGSTGGFDLSSISKQVNTTFSSVSGGGETTTSRKQSTESSAAEKEMESLTKKFREDFDARKKVLVEGMAVEDRKYSNVQKAMKADEIAIKLKEEYQAKQTEIQKKIDAGITWETTKKAAQVEENRKLAAEELATKNTATGKFDPNVNDGGTAHREGEREYARKFAAEGNLANAAKLNADFDKALGITSTTATSTSTTAAKPTTTSAQPSTPAAKPTTAPISAMNAAERMLGIKTQTAEIPKAVKQADAKTETTAAAAAAAANKPKPADTPSVKPTVGTKDATLNDVVGSLNMLNKQMGQLLSQQQDIGARQIKATKSNSSNIYAR